MKDDYDLWKVRGESRRRSKARKDEHRAMRKAQAARIAPVLESMPWRKILAGHDRVNDIKSFIRHYGMYVPLLAEHEKALVNARDSGLYESFDLYASVKMIVVEGIDRRGNAKAVVVVGKHYWEDTYRFTPGNYSPW